MCVLIFHFPVWAKNFSPLPINTHQSLTFNKFPCKHSAGGFHINVIRAGREFLHIDVVNSSVDTGVRVYQLSVDIIQIYFIHIRARHGELGLHGIGVKVDVAVVDNIGVEILASVLAFIVVGIGADGHELNGEVVSGIVSCYERVRYLRFIYRASKCVSRVGTSHYRHAVAR